MSFQAIKKINEMLPWNIKKPNPANVSQALWCIDMAFYFKEKTCWGMTVSNPTLCQIHACCTLGTFLWKFFSWNRSKPDDRSYEAYSATNSQTWNVPGLSTALHGPTMLFEATGPSSISWQSRYMMAVICLLSWRGVCIIICPRIIGDQKKTFTVVHSQDFCFRCFDCISCVKR